MIRATNTEKRQVEKIGVSVEEAAQILGVGRNLMLDIVKIKGFPAIRFQRKIIINSLELPIWFKENYGQFTRK